MSGVIHSLKLGNEQQTFSNYLTLLGNWTPIPGHK